MLEERLLGEAAIRFVARTRWPRVPRWRTSALIAGASSLAIAAVVILASLHARDLRRQSGSLASVRAVGATTFSRLRPPPDEVIRLDAGALEITVAPSDDGRRLRVETDDASIDVSAGRFRVEASAHMLVAMRVFAGYAEVATKGEHAALRAGDEWERAPDNVGANMTDRVAPLASQASIAPSRSLAPPAPSVSAAGRAARAHSFKPAPLAMLALPSRPTSNPTAPMADTTRASFERGWNLLRGGDPAGAAAAFAEVDALAKGNAIAEDALFWQAVSLEKANQKEEAHAAMSRFLSRFPDSARFGEASALVGWMLLDAGDKDAARLAFERALHDRVARVRASAESGLEQLGVAPTAPK